MPVIPELEKARLRKQLDAEMMYRPQAPTPVRTESLPLRAETKPQLPEDVNLVWVLSGPGTHDQPPEKGLYAGKPKDKERIDMGTQAVLEVVATKLGKQVEELTNYEILTHSPWLFYNGETKGQGAYAQNEAMRRFVRSETFPLSTTKVVVSDLEEIYTPGQIKNLAVFLAQHPWMRKVAVVTHEPHMLRMMRYLNQHKHLFPNIEFVEYGVRETDFPVEAEEDEKSKVLTYLEKGDLAYDGI